MDLDVVDALVCWKISQIEERDVFTMPNRQPLNPFLRGRALRKATRGGGRARSHIARTEV